ncbi:hypothetical protein ACFE04_010300 [Oxalis oulophora]
MGNKLGRRRNVVDEKYTKPQGLYVHKDVDIKKLRKLILESKLAPCYPGDEESCHDLEECPICFLCYPSLNRSECCKKGICTECFLQMKNPNSTCPTHLSLNFIRCPFCKTTNYAVQYRGVKTKEEKGLEQIEEQRVIEAKIRMRQQEIQEEEESIQNRQGLSYSSMTFGSGERGYGSIEDPRPLVEGEEEWRAGPMNRHPSHTRTDRDDELDVDLEDIMVMEAIWLSIQENGRQRGPSYGDVAPCDQYMTAAMASTSQSGDFACLDERRQMVVGGPSMTSSGSIAELDVDDVHGVSSSAPAVCSDGSFSDLRQSSVLTGRIHGCTWGMLI